MPISYGGSDGIENLQPLCWSCNASKGSERINWLVLRERFGREVQR